MVEAIISDGRWKVAEKVIVCPRISLIMLANVGGGCNCCSMAFPDVYRC